MARGFESKDVEQQQQDAEERRANARRVALSAEEAEVNRKRDGLMLQRTRILRKSKSPRMTAIARRCKAGCSIWTINLRGSRPQRKPCASWRSKADEPSKLKP